MTSPNNRVHIVGLGLLGGSLAAALTRAGFIVSGSDLDKTLVDAALASRQKRLPWRACRWPGRKRPAARLT